MPHIGHREVISIAAVVFHCYYYPDLIINFTMPYKFEYWAIQTIAMLLTAFVIPGLTISGPLSALCTVLVLSLVNTYLWDAALFFAIPNDLSLHTLVLFLTNGVLFWIIVKILPGIAVRGVLPALVAPVIFTVTSILLQRYGAQIDWQSVLAQAREFWNHLQGYTTAAKPDQQSLQLLFSSLHLRT